MDINKLKEEAYQTAVDHGWYEQKRSITHHIMMVVTELGEAINADRSRKYAERVMFEEMIELDYPFSFDVHWAACFEQYIKDSVEDELADAVIRLLTILGGKGVTIPEDSFSEEGLANGVDAANDSIAKHNNSVEPTLPEELIVIVTSLMNPEDTLIEAVYFLMAIAMRRNIDINWYVVQKMKYNKLRPYMHGDKKY